jgi:GH25 family lysozyme M1 (1,4-beta-N-acetylmuramidase)
VTEPLLVDCSPWSSLKPEAWARLAAAGPPWAGVVLKGGQGLRDTGSWVREHAPAVREAGLELGLYWYLRLDRPGADQADALAELMAEQACTLWPSVDVEEGGGDGRPSNDALVAQRGAGIVDTVTRAFVERLRARTGLPTILYTGGWLRSLRLRSLLGCELLWLAAYTAELPARWYEHDLGCPRDRLWAWQYMGQSGRGALAELAGYPHTSPIGDDLDISAVVMRGGVEHVGVAERTPRPT